MTDLYALLGVARDAQPAAIRAAFRRQAKTAHPDAGGGAERFALLTRAKTVLLDEARRARYDQTGEVDDGADNARAMAMDRLVQVTTATMEKAIQNGGDPERFDVVAATRVTINREIAQHQSARAEMPERAARLRQIAERFTAKEGAVNMLRAAYEHQATAVEASVANLDRQVAVLRAALVILDEHLYRADVPVRMPEPWINPMGVRI